MTKLATAIASLLFVTLHAHADRPLLVGHRGCGYGVENTAQAFVAGAEMGYDYLECDIRVTADTCFVISHDESTERLGGSLKIADATLEQLRAERYTQTRNGVTYSGASICTLNEYLAICRRFSVNPVIELKWGTGINNDDCSNVPRLIDLITRLGFRGRCIILTSMRSVLDYIRLNYPDVTLQFLTSQYWKNHVAWTLDHRLDVDVNHEYVDPETVATYHDAGLKVNTWTVNSLAEYFRLADLGVDFVTTDRLSPRSLPE